MSKAGMVKTATKINGAGGQPFDLFGHETESLSIRRNPGDSSESLPLTEKKSLLSIQAPLFSNNLFYFSGIVISFFLTVILVSKRGRTRSDLLLAAWLALTCFHFVLYYIFANRIFLQFPYLLGFELPLPLLYSPFLFLYAQSLTQNRNFSFTWLLHFLPALALYIRLVPFYLLPPGEKIYVYENEGIGYETLLAINRVAIIVSGVAYIFATLWILRRHRKNIEEEFSNTDKINLNWLRYLTYGTAAIWLMIIAGPDDRWIYVTAALYVFFLGYFGIRQAGIFSNRPAESQKPEVLSASAAMAEIQKGDLLPSEKVAATLPDPVVPPKVKYQKSTLSEEEGRRIHEQLTASMDNEELFRNPELSLAEVAKQLEVHPNILSQVINSFEQQSFYDYINRHRIEAFKKTVARPDHRQFTLLALAFDCGFNSKTSFNRNFRKATGLSPSEYLQQQAVTLAG
jgi:AraC-like DNA-binding protein